MDYTLLERSWCILACKRVFELHRVVTLFEGKVRIGRREHMDNESLKV